MSLGIPMIIEYFKVSGEDISHLVTYSHGEVVFKIKMGEQYNDLYDFLISKKDDVINIPEFYDYKGRKRSGNYKISSITKDSDYINVKINKVI